MADDTGLYFPTEQWAHAPADKLAAPLPVAPSQPALRSESSGQRAIALFHEAKAAGEEHVTVFLQTLELVVKQAREIVDGKEVYPAGVRDICEKLTEHSASRAQAIFSIMRPEGPGRPPAPFEDVMPQPSRSLEEADLEKEINQRGDGAFGRRA
jgi:hypothetical protein